MSEYALTLATALSMELHCETCPALREGPLTRKGYFTVYFSEHGRAVMAGVPKHCLKDKGRTILVDVVLNSTDKVDAFLTLLKLARVDAALVTSVVMSCEVGDALHGKGIKSFSLLVQ